MKSLVNLVLQVLKDTYLLVKEIKQHIGQRRLPLEKRRRWTKWEVIQELGMSESTYNRHIKSGLLRPMRLTGEDNYFDEDLQEAFEQSRLKGRI